MLKRMISALFGGSACPSKPTPISRPEPRPAAPVPVESAHEDEPRPTEKQLKYARSLGIENASGMGRYELSDAISEREKDPSLMRKLKSKRKQTKEKNFGKEVVEQEAYWQRIADDVRFILAIYARGKNLNVDVLEVFGATLTDRGKVRVEVAAPKRVRQVAGFDGSKNVYCTDLEWERTFEISAEAIKHHEPLPDFNPGYQEDGFEAYQAAVKKGLQIAERLAKE